MAEYLSEKWIGRFLMIYICNFHVLSHLLLIYICKLHWSRLYRGVFVSRVCGYYGNHSCSFLVASYSCYVYVYDLHISLVAKRHTYMWRTVSVLALLLECLEGLIVLVTPDAFLPWVPGCFQDVEVKFVDSEKSDDIECCHWASSFFFEILSIFAMTSGVAGTTFLNHWLSWSLGTLLTKL